MFGNKEGEIHNVHRLGEPGMHCRPGYLVQTKLIEAGDKALSFLSKLLEYLFDGTSIVVRFVRFSIL